VVIEYPDTGVLEEEHENIPANSGRNLLCLMLFVLAEYCMFI